MRKQKLEESQSRELYLETVSLQQEAEETNVCVVALSYCLWPHYNKDYCWAFDHQNNKWVLHSSFVMEKGQFIWNTGLKSDQSNAVRCS